MLGDPDGPAPLAPGDQVPDIPGLLRDQGLQVSVVTNTEYVWFWKLRKPNAVSS